MNPIVRTAPAALLALLVACGKAATLSCPPAADSPDAGPGDLLAKSQLDAWLQPVFDGHYIHGMALGLIDQSGAVVYGFGTVGDGAAAPRGDTIFQIGSVTKTFTGLWLATQLTSGALQADQPVQNLLPATVKVPSYQGAAISLQDLATHTSGLPDAPTNLVASDPLNPWAGYTVASLYSFLAGDSLTYAPGSKWVYSNVGEGLLGLALELRAGGTYDDNIQRVVAAPLGLVDTTATLSACQEQRFAPGYDGDLNATEPWTFTEAIGAAGALRSTVNDLLKYAAAQAGLTHSGLDAAMALSQQAIHPTALPGYSIGLNWLIAPDGVVWHNGGVLGGTAFVGFDPVKHLAAVLLVDTGAENTQTSMGFDLTTSLGLLTVGWLKGTAPPSLSSVLPPSASLTSQQLQRLAGTYNFTVGGGTYAAQVAVKGDKLQAAAPFLWPQPIFLYPAASSSFTCREIAASAAFEDAADGGVAALDVTLAGQTLRGTRQ